MSGSVIRPQPVRQAIVDSLMFTSPPSLDHLADLLSEASSKAGWAAWEIRPGADGVCHKPSASAIRDSLEAVLHAYLGLYATLYASAETKQ